MSFSRRAIRVFYKCCSIYIGQFFISATSQAVYHTRTMTTIQTSVPKESVQTAPNWSDWFGVSPRGEAVVTNPYSTYSRETLALPEVYKGSNPYLTNVMIRIIDDEQLIPTKILLPIRQTQNETSVTWDEFHFNNTLLGPVPEEGVSRLVTQQISERRDHYVRYGLAFMIEHGFMNSPKGQMSYEPRANPRCHSAIPLHWCHREPSALQDEQPALHAVLRKVIYGCLRAQASRHGS